MPAGIRSRLVTPRRRSRLAQWLKAAHTHVSALLREFRAPLIGFALATIGGGILYGEVYHAVRGVFIPWVDRPYVMLQLMLIEAPETVPPELALVAFWYAMPAVFIVLLGLGANDFLDLFFNREDHRDRWGEAIAMSYHNHAIVLGAGHVGLRVIRDLHDLGMEVSVIDQAPSDAARDALGSWGVPCVQGDVRVASTMDHAGLSRAEVFVACTGDDRLNLEVVMKVREKAPSVRIIARVWDRAIGDRMERFGLADLVMSAADLSAPAFAGAAVGIEITQTLLIAGKEYSTVRMAIPEGSFMAGRTVGELEDENEMEVVLVEERGTVDGVGKVTIDPDRDVAVRPGQHLVIFARHDRVLEVVSRNRRHRR